MEVRIGIVNAPREIALESSQTPEEIEDLVAAALAGTQLVLTDDKGKKYIVPSAGIAYVEIGAEKARTVGFVA